MDSPMFLDTSDVVELHGGNCQIIDIDFTKEVLVINDQATFATPHGVFYSKADALMFSNIKAKQASDEASRLERIAALNAQRQAQLDALAQERLTIEQMSAQLQELKLDPSRFLGQINSQIASLAPVHPSTGKVQVSRPGYCITCGVDSGKLSQCRSCYFSSSRIEPVKAPQVEQKPEYDLCSCGKRKQSQYLKCYTCNLRK